jgi:hypothetical protein
MWCNLKSQMPHTIEAFDARWEFRSFSFFPVASDESELQMAAAARPFTTRKAASIPSTLNGLFMQACSIIYFFPICPLYLYLCARKNVKYHPSALNNPALTAG